MPTGGHYEARLAAERQQQPPQQQQQQRQHPPTLQTPLPAHRREVLTITLSRRICQHPRRLQPRLSLQV